jgi:uncharacterized membrane protein YfcA
MGRQRYLLVPALVLLGALPMSAAVGTSLVVIAMQSFAGLAGHLAGTSIDWRWRHWFLRRKWVRPSAPRRLPGV